MAVLARGGVHSCGQKDLSGVSNLASSWLRAIAPELEQPEKAGEEGKGKGGEEGKVARGVCHHTHSIPVDLQTIGRGVDSFLDALTLRPSINITENLKWNAFQNWRREPMLQSFGIPPSDPALDYVQTVEAGAILCELLSQSSFTFSNRALLNIFPNLQRAAMEEFDYSHSPELVQQLSDLVTNECASMEGAYRLVNSVMPS